MNRQLDNKLGSQRKVSVSAPKLREKKPNLIFKAPTYKLWDSSILSTRQGGPHYSTALGLFLIFLALTVNPVRKGLSNGVKVFREWTKIDMLCSIYGPVININVLCYYPLLGTRPPREDLNGVCSIELKTLCKFSLPPE